MTVRWFVKKKGRVWADQTVDCEGQTAFPLT